MKKPLQERLDAVRRELQEQDAAWRRAREVLERLGDVRIPVPREALEQLEAPIDPCPPRMHGVRA